MIFAVYSLIERLGDSEVGSSVRLLSVHPDGRACFIEGNAVQGWEVEGWVACNRLLFDEPTPVAEVDADGE